VIEFFLLTALTVWVIVDRRAVAKWRLLLQRLNKILQ
jgi:hypothetical protein